MLVLFSNSARTSFGVFINSGRPLYKVISCLAFRQGFSLSQRYGPFFHFFFSFFTLFSLVTKQAYSVLFSFVSSINSNTSMVIGSMDFRCFSCVVLNSVIKITHSVLLFKTASVLLFFSFMLKNSSVFLFNSLLDIFMTDMLGSLHNARFFLFYCFLNIVQAQRVFLQFSCSEFSSIFSLTALFYSASWLEREC